MINPVRYKPPVAPAVAAEKENRPVDWDAMAESLQRLDQDHDVLLVEGVGGWHVPLDEKRSVEDLAQWIGYPVAVVAASMAVATTTV